ncbi:MAG: hypothetical protein GF349_04965 [Candidatus Magasanikbacteria bacterium]|nr:hypothetical protein [Candidatus Magasanikbacteria bacterium]
MGNLTKDKIYVIFDCHRFLKEDIPNRYNKEVLYVCGFFCPEGPYKKECYECDCSNFTKTGNYDPSCRNCHGVGKCEYETSAPPAFNLCNTSARALLRSIGKETDDLRGRVTPAEASVLIRRVLLVLNSEKKIKSYVYPTQVTSYEGGPILIECGLDTQRVYRMLRSLIVLLRQGVENGWEVCWY